MPAGLSNAEKEDFMGERWKTLSEAEKSMYTELEEGVHRVAVPLEMAETAATADNHLLVTSYDDILTWLAE